ncbi:MAG TPA: hypothetical protein V6D08_06835 [Candidatus Obscuribacterales bacterium]
MAQRKPAKKVSIEEILRLVEQLTPEEQSELRRAFFEEQEDISIALERLANPGKTWSHEEMKQELGLAD